MTLKASMLQAQQQRRIKNIQAFVLLALLLGFWVRVYGAFNYPFVFDEPRIIQNGVRDMNGVGPDQHLGTGPTTVIFGVPLRNGYFLSPLWWWIQYTVRALNPNNETQIYRILPVVSGLLGIALFYQLSRKIFRSPLPELLTLILSTFDLHVYITSKSQYPTALLLLSAELISFALIFGLSKNRYKVFVAVGITIALGTQLGKGIALLGTYIIASLLQALTIRKSDTVINRLIALVKNWTWIGVTLIPISFWWIGAEWFLLHNQVRVHDFGYYAHLWEPIYDLTIGYGPHLRTYLYGYWYWPLLIYNQADAWPTLTFLATLAVVGICIASWNLIKRDRARSRLSIYILVSIVLILGAQVARDADAPRDNILYLPALLLSVGLALEWLWIQSAGTLGRRISGCAIFVLLGSYLYFMFGWQRWPDQWINPGLPGITVIIIAILLAINYVAAPSNQVRKLSVVGLVMMGVVLSVVRGPLHWGTFAYAEPGPTNPNLHDVEVLYHPVQYFPPDNMQVKLNAQFSDGLTLLGYDTELADANLIITLHWRTNEPPNDPYHSFVHLWDPVTETVGLGFDERSLNRQGLPMNEWLEGEHVSQTVVLDLSSLPAGSYTLGTGLYDYATYERLAVLDKFGSPVLNNLLPLLTEFELSEANP